jgi:hypothetical protein
MSRNTLMALLSLVAVCLGGCMLPQPDTPPIPPLLGFPGAPGAPAAAKAPPASAVTRDAAKQAAPAPGAAGERQPVPDTVAMLPPGAALQDPAGVAGGQAATTGALGGSDGPVMNREAADSAPVAAASALPSTEPSPEGPATPTAVVAPAGAVSVGWSDQSGIEGARLVLASGQLPVGPDPVAVPPGTYTVEVLVGGSWQALTGAITLRSGETLELTLGVDEAGARLVRSRSR